VDSATGTWHVNGKRLFIRGTNVIPTLWLAHYGYERIQRDIALLKDAGVNAVRVCVHVSNPAFYDACDRAGILIWQDFLLQWGYTNENSVVHSAVTQIKDMVRGLRHHPSIGVWCCQNESLFFNNEVVGPQLARAAREEDASRYVHPVSQFNEHPYPGWYFGSMDEFKALPGGRMITEFGAQALPSVQESIALNGGAFWPPDWDRLGFHDFQYDQTFFVARVDRGDNWETFVRNSQRYQAKLLKTAIESFRKSRFQKVGSYFQFMFMDCWPAITWSVVSFDRVPKLGYRTMQQINQPVLAGVSLGRSAFYRRLQKGGGDSTIQIAPWVINDLHQRFEGCVLTAELVHGETGKRTQLQSTTLTLEPDSLLELGPIVIAYDGRFVPGSYELSLCVTHAGRLLNENVYEVEFGE
jgi:beta-mannosidase